MYRCYASGVLVSSRNAAHKVVIEVRPKEYPYRRSAIPLRIKGKKNKVLRDDAGGNGWEAVREVMMCEQAALAFNQAVAEHPEGMLSLSSRANTDQFLNAARQATAGE